MSDVLIRREGAAGHITLNRPRALNALTQAMCEEMSAAVLEWREDASVACVILDHAEGRGFCAGGDVGQVRASAMNDAGAAGRAFFHAEYRLNHLLFTYPKPVIAFMDGMTMGGGVGISLPAQYRVATENTLFAMPEGAIGLFPDVGAGWYLPRLPGMVGKFLALTGARLDGAECLWAGLATHYCAAESLVELKAKIAANPQQIAELLKEFSSMSPQPRLAGNAERIDRLFAPTTLEGIIAALRADPSDWAAKELKAVTTKCLTSAKVALRLFEQGAAVGDFTAEMTLEYRLAARMMLRGDFVEGVRAVLVDKDHAPQWNPAAAEDVTEAMLDAIFSPLPPSQEWTPFPS